MSKFDDLLAKLREVFQIDQPELDFGIYRIINQRATDIDRYLTKTLKQKVQEELSKGSSHKRAELQEELQQKEEQYRADGVDPDTVPKIKELRDQIAAMGDEVDYETEVYSHLLRFFSRYYEKGDFISRRRYKGDTYAIPYDGEEVVLHWANKDQYYTKSSENFTHYRFTLSDGRKVHLRLIAADTAKNNNKDTNGQERRFVLAESIDEHPQIITESDGELTIRFEYKPFDKATKQADLIAQAIKAILDDPTVAKTWTELAKPMPTPANPDRTLLEKHLNDYTQKNKADYFIHKDLGGFLSRELDFYIKNEVMNLDDVQSVTTFQAIETQLRMIQTLRAIAMDLIRFLSQIEDFQKKLWLKKKFVIETNYCITLDRVPEELYPDIAANDAQREEWIRLFAIDEIKAENLGQVAYSKPLKLEFLKSNPLLVLDTAYFPADFKYKLLAAIDNLDEKIDGVLIHSENFQGLGLLNCKYTERVRCIYIDPPFNLGEDPDYYYKVDYKDDTWLTLLENRVSVCRKLLKPEGSMMVRCNHDGNMLVRQLMNSVFGQSNYRNEIIVRRAEESKGDLNRQFAGVRSITVNYDNLYWFSNHPGTRFERFLKRTSAKQSKSHWHSFWKAEDRPNLRYDILGIDLREHYGQWMWKKERAFKAVKNYEEYCQETKKTGESLDDYWERTGKQLEFVSRQGDGYSSIKYWIPPRSHVMADNNWLDIKGYANKWSFKTENSEGLMKRIVSTLSNGKQDLVLDFFVGSGTTAAVAHKLGRKWLAIDMGDHVETIARLRLRHVLAGERSGISKEVDWKGGGCFKYLCLESYEDTLNNLRLQRTGQQGDFLAQRPDLAQDYLLGYMLDVESRGSLLNTDTFKKPFDYWMDIASDSAGATEPQKVDLVETFNYLVGLQVDKIDARLDRGYLLVEGRMPTNERTLVIWRDCEQVGYDDLKAVCDRLNINPLDTEYDVIYINGDHNIANIETSADADGEVTRTLKVRQIEDEFFARMFDGEDV